MKKFISIFLAILGMLIFSCGDTSEEATVGASYTLIAELSDESEDYDFEWEFLEGPETSLLSLEEMELSNDISELSFIPDVVGEYIFQVKTFYGRDEVATQSFNINVVKSDYEEEIDLYEVPDEDLFIAEETGWLEEGIEPLDTVIKKLPIDIVETTRIAEKEEDITPPPTAKPKLTPKPIPGSSIPYDTNRFTIQIGAKKTLKEAEALVAELDETGYDAYIQKAYFKETDDIWYRIRVGSYENRDTANAVAKSLAAIRATTTWVDYVRLEY